MTTRRAILLLLRKHPGTTVSELARRLHLTDMGVRRHIDALAADGLAEPVPARSPRGVGRPPSGWQLTAAGDEEFPRRYDQLAVELLEDVADTGGPAALEAALHRRTAKLAQTYEARLAGAESLTERVERLAALRDADGYLAESGPAPDHEDDLLLTENNCAVHRVARRFPVLCAMELTLFRRCLGPQVDVTRETHALGGDAVCCYRIRPTGTDDRS